MADPPPPPSPQPDSAPANDRLDSWKEIAAYMRRDVTTVQRWERREGMPVHRHIHDKLGSVYASRRDLDAWTRARRTTAIDPPDFELTTDASSLPHELATAGRRRRVVWLASSALLALLAVAIWQVQWRQLVAEDPLVNARFSLLTNFDGIEQAAALSRDGRSVAFLSDRDGQMDVWVTQPGVGELHNLTRGGVAELVNPSVRTLGFSPDSTLVTFWARHASGSASASISIWAVPVVGGEPRVYLEDGAELDWSPDATQLVYHTAGAGDPMYVRDSRAPTEPGVIFSAPPGLHAHFPVWSPDQALIYFVQGAVPDRMDIWRIPATGGAPERMTEHDSLVSHPVFLNPQTLLYLASDRDGSGPWIHSLDLEGGLTRRVNAGVDRYTSLATSADGRRLTATLARPKSTLWRLPLAGAPVGMTAASRVPLTTGNGASPRLGPDYLLYVSSQGNSDSIWKLRGEQATELWSAADARIIGGPAIARDGRRISFSVARNGQTELYTVNDDGSDARIITESFDLTGGPAWAPDDQSLTIAALVGGVPCLYSIPLDGRPPRRVLGEHSVSPAWSPDGSFAVFSGPDIGTTFKVQAVTAAGRPYRLPELTLTRGARRLSFLPGTRSLVVLRGEIRHKNLWLLDLDTGAERQLTDLPSDFEVRNFDIAPDGREIVVERVQDDSDIVLIDVAGR